MKKFITLLFILFVAISSVGCQKSEELSLYDITAIVRGNEIECEMDFTFFNDSKNIVNELYFCLYPNAFRKDAKIKPVSAENSLKAYPNGESYGKITINSVKHGNKNLDYLVMGEDENILKVSLDKRVEFNKSYKLSIDFDLVVPNVLHRYGYGDNTFNLSNFYPVLCQEYNGEIYKSVYYSSGDPFYTDVSNYKVSITVPSTYVVASSLSATGTECMGEKTRYLYERESVRDIAFILSEKFNILKERVGSTDIYYYYFNDSTPEKSLDVIKNSFKFYSENFSKYPYSEYVVCEADFIYGGMEYPCLTIVDKRLTGEEKDYCLAHETAHQWWYGLVGVNQSEEGFIDEGLTEFSTVLFLEKYTDKTRQEYVNEAKEKYREIRKFTVHYENGKSAKMQRNLGSFTNDAEYVSIAYYRSQIMFNELYDFLGEKKGKKFLKGISSNFKYKNVTYNGLSKFAEKVKSGSKKLLDGYVLGKTAI